jgi:flagellar basal-body rod protein FlgF
MIRGMYTSASGMTTSLNQMGVIGNNLSNVNTPAYKEKQNVYKTFPEQDLVRTNDQETATSDVNFDKRPEIGSLGTGVASDGTYTNYTQGSLRKTENPLDVALEGKGFFTVQMPEGERAYTRDGTFKLNDQNQLVTSSGRRILGTNGEPIQLPADSSGVTITPDGNIYDSNDQLISQFRVVQFENPQKLRELGENLYRQGENNDVQFPAEDVLVRQGVVEQPNFSPVKQMTSMIEVSKRYEMNSQVLKQQNSSLGQAISQVGRP